LVIASATSERSSNCTSYCNEAGRAASRTTSVTVAAIASVGECWSALPEVQFVTKCNQVHATAGKQFRVHPLEVVEGTDQPPAGSAAGPWEAFQDDVRLSIRQRGCDLTEDILWTRGRNHGIEASAASSRLSAGRNRIEALLHTSKPAPATSLRDYPQMTKSQRGVVVVPPSAMVKIDRDEGTSAAIPLWS